MSRPRRLARGASLMILAALALAAVFLAAFWPAGPPQVADPTRSAGACGTGTPTPYWEYGKLFEATAKPN